MDSNSLQRTHRTVDGHEFRVLADDVPGDKPYVITVGTRVLSLDRNLKCAEDEGCSLVSVGNIKHRYLNLYRAADGGICFGRRSWASLDEVQRLTDTERALAILRISFNENTHAAAIDVCEK